MRYISDGPDIPDELIEARNAGRVVFFCGAGVSVPAKLPSFFDLTMLVMEKLGVSSDSKYLIELRKAVNDREYKLPFSLDDAFYYLQAEYGSEIVEAEVSALLKVNSKAMLDCHKTILRLSTQKDGSPKIVTTNYDLLFEKADKQVKFYIPPSLPELASGQELDGVVYLHGRWSRNPRPSGSAHGLILSSADFGRAYLADGWASKFIKELAKKYVIVLLGYSADDPPVRYLLEGLHTRGGAESSVYAFDRGSLAYVENKWKHKGVQGVPFLEFEDLWKSLNVWADFAGESEKWGEHVRNLSQKNPKLLQPFERRQVAHFISSWLGAKTFAEFHPSPCAEWICVFDSQIRNDIVDRLRVPQFGAVYNPQSLYGLDNDPCVNEKKDYRGIDYLKALPGDVLNTVDFGLNSSGGIHLPERINRLARWLCEKIEDTVFLWWVVRQGGELHPWFRELIKRNVYFKCMSADEELRPLMKVWDMWLESKAPEPHALSCFLHDIKTVGWNDFMVRRLEAIISPFFLVKHSDQKPPVFGARRLDEVVKISVGFNDIKHQQLQVSSDFVEPVLSALSNALKRMCDLLKCVDDPDDIGILDKGYGDWNDDVCFFNHLFALWVELAKSSPEQAKKVVEGWPSGQHSYFYQIRVRAWTSEGVFSADEIGQGVLTLPENFFWFGRSQEHFMKLLVREWAGMSKKVQETIIDRIVAGCSRDLFFSDVEYDKWSHLLVAQKLGQLETNKCALPDFAKEKLEKLRQCPDWSPELEALEPRESWKIMGVSTSENIDIFSGIHLSEIVEVAIEKDGFDRKNLVRRYAFRGFVREDPLRGLEALVLASKKNIHAPEQWACLLNTDSPQLSNPIRWQIAKCLVRLPNEQFSQMAITISSFFSSCLPELAQENMGDALDVFDAMLSRLIDLDVNSLKSGCSEVVYREGIRSRSVSHSYAHALESPVGLMAMTLMTIFWPQLKKSSGLTTQFSCRLEKMLGISLLDEKRHVACLVAQQINGLFFYDRKWVEKNLLPLFDIDNPLVESAWEGALRSKEQFDPKLFALLRTLFPILSKKSHEWLWPSNLVSLLHQQLVLACRKGRCLENYPLMREAIKHASDRERAEVLRFLARDLPETTENWPSIRKIIKEAWPRELQFRSEETTKRFLYLITKVGDNFPQAVATVKSFLVPLQSYDIYDFYTDGFMQLRNKYPTNVIDIMDAVIDENTRLPYEFFSYIESMESVCPEISCDKRVRKLRDYGRRYC